MRERETAAEEQVRDALAQLRALSPPAPDTAAATQRRARLTRAMRAALAGEGAGLTAGGARPGWRRLLGWGTVAVGAAAALVLVLVIGPGRGTRPVDRGQPLTSGAAITIVAGAVTLEADSVSGGRQPLASGQHHVVGERDVLQTATTGEAAVRLGDVGRMTLRPSTRVVGIATAAGAVERVTLTQGRAHLSIAKLAPGRTFRVVTDAATVQVHGTEFDVEIGAGATPRTCVRVQDGLVEVVAGRGPAVTRTFLKPGQSWACDDAVHPLAAPDPQTSPAAHSATTAARRPGTNVPAAGELRRQNQLFEEALRAERAGHRRQAADLYRRLVSLYPSGPLARQAARQLDAMRASD